MPKTKSPSKSGRGRGRGGKQSSPQEKHIENHNDPSESPSTKRSSTRTSSRRTSTAAKEEHVTEKDEEKEKYDEERNEEANVETLPTDLKPSKSEVEQTPAKRKGRLSVPRSSTKKPSATPKSRKKKDEQLPSDAEIEEQTYIVTEKDDENEVSGERTATETPRKRRKNEKSESTRLETPVAETTETPETARVAMELDSTPADDTREEDGRTEEVEMEECEKETTAEQEETVMEAESTTDLAPEVEARNDQNTPIDAMSARLAKLAQLRERLSQSSKDNRADVIAEHARNKTNPKLDMRTERKKTEAEKLLARKEAEEKGEDYQRKKYWNYSAEDASKWEKAQSKKVKRSDNAFTDYNQVAHKKYKKLVNEIKPNLSAYNDARHAIEAMEGSGEAGSKEFSELLYRDANSLSYGGEGSKVSKDAAERLSEWQLDQIEKRNATSRRRPYSEDQDITYINERNARFNKKIARVYDKATKEIRDNFERGTAL